MEKVLLIAGGGTLGTYVADIYMKLLNVQFEWVPANYSHNVWNWYYDRAYDRKIDNSKVLKKA